MALAPLASILPLELADTDLDTASALEGPWVTIVWDDPVNLMSYVTYVFQSYFGYPKPKAESLMMSVHHEGRAAVSVGGRDAMERHVEALHEFGLWATLQKDE